MLRISIYDDNHSFRQTIELIVEMSDNMTLAGSYPDALQVVETVQEDQPDVVLMDIEMPQRSGIEAVILLNNTLLSPPKILMLTAYEDTESVFAAIKAGAVGYLLKKTPAEKIIEGIDEVAQGGAAMSPSVALKVLGAFQKPVKKTVADLTPKELEVLKRLVEGDSYKLIAYHCQISISTVQTHIMRIYEKLHVNSKGEAIHKALKDRIVDLRA
jgi:DNA-binding NarL/FixJ family response regulator